MVPITTGFKQTPTNLASVRVRLYLFPHGCPAAGSLAICCLQQNPRFVGKWGWLCAACPVYVCCYGTC